MTTTTIPEPTRADTRELRALKLYRDRGHEIRQASPGEDLYLVPSCTSRGFYSVDYRQETCDCPDFLRRRENCKHILAAGVHVAKRRHQDSESSASPHACDDGWVTIGQLVVDPETGEETEEYALYLCRRCANEAGRKPRPDSPCIHHQRERHRDRAYATANIRLWSLATVASRA